MGFLDWMFPESQYSYVHVNDVPNYSEIKGGLVYDTAESKFYRIRYGTLKQLNYTQVYIKQKMAGFSNINITRLVAI